MHITQQSYCHAMARVLALETCYFEKLIIRWDEKNFRC